MTAIDSVPSVRRHPFRGAFAGLLAGFGLALVLISLAVIALGTLTPVVIVVCGMVVGVLVGTLPPARGRSSPADGEPIEPPTQA